MPDRRSDKMSKYMPEKMSDRMPEHILRKYVRIVFQDGGHSNRVFLVG